MSLSGDDNQVGILKHWQTVLPPDAGLAKWNQYA
jgi:hypothetical protein